MIQLCAAVDANHQLLLTLLYDNLFSIVSFLYNHPLQFAYFLYFSPYIFQLLSFFSPLLFSTTILLFLCSVVEAEASIVCLIDQLDVLVVTSVGDVFEWEFDAADELYRNVGLICEVENYADEIYVENFEKSELYNNGGLIFGVDEDPAQIHVANSEKSEHLELQRRSMGELSEISSVNCDMISREDPVELSLEKSEKSEILESRSTECSFVPQTPDRTPEVLVRSWSVRRAKHNSGDLGSLRRGRSMRSSGEFSMHSVVDYEVAETPTDILPRNRSRTHRNLENSHSITDRDEEDRALETLQRDGSIRKGKEWKRTLACKLYEERMTFQLCEERTLVEGAEEMDLLWEAYESDADKAHKFKNKGNADRKQVNIVEEEEEDNDEEDDSVGQLCCLQALSFSTAKMNLGVRKQNLARISKVLNSTGFFRRSSSTRSKRG